jgi:hypothetical protein
MAKKKDVVDVSIREELSITQSYIALVDVHTIVNGNKIDALAGDKVFLNADDYNQLRRYFAS